MVALFLVIVVLIFGILLQLDRCLVWFCTKLHFASIYFNSSMIHWFGLMLETVGWVLYLSIISPLWSAWARTGQSHRRRMVPFLDRHLIFPVFNFLQAEPNMQRQNVFQTGLWGRLFFLTASASKLLKLLHSVFCFLYCWIDCCVFCTVSSLVIYLLLMMLMRFCFFRWVSNVFFVSMFVPRRLVYTMPPLSTELSWLSLQRRYLDSDEVWTLPFS